MVIVNPYLKKKKPLVGGWSGGANCPSSSKNTSNMTRTDKDGRFNPYNQRPIQSHGTASLKTENLSKSQPSRVSPNGKQTVTTNNANRRNAPSSSLFANKPHTSSLHSTKQERTISTGGAAIPNAGGTARDLHGKNVKRSSKSKLSVKQRLKQEIAALKKQKQLKKLQREAESRRRDRLAEKRAEEDRRRALLAAREEEKRQKQAERERLAALTEEEKVRKS